MDDDFTFGASVWGATEPPPVVSKPTSLIGLPPSSLVSSPPTFQDDGFGDFDDFEGPQANQDVSFNGDDFDDFGDFGDVDAVPPSASGFGFGESIAGPSVQREWQPLYLDPVPSHLELQEEVEEILGPVWDDEALARAMSDEQIREVEGVGQILQYAESRDLFNNIVKLAPPTKPPNWVRSKIRRQHLIALGIPVNLDEVLEPQANTKSMPSLQVNTRPMSAPPGPRNGHIYTGAITSSLSNSRSGTPQPGNRGQSSHFGPKPELDQVKIHSLLQLDPDSLAILPLPVLERHLADLRSHLANTNTLLTHLLQARDALQQDSETYNRLIAELVGEAQKIKIGKRNPPRRGSGMV